MTQSSRTGRGSPVDEAPTDERDADATEDTAETPSQSKTEDGGWGAATSTTSSAAATGSAAASTPGLSTTSGSSGNGSSGSSGNGSSGTGASGSTGRNGAAWGSSPASGNDTRTASVPPLRDSGRPPLVTGTAAPGYSGASGPGSTPATPSYATQSRAASAASAASRAVGRAGARGPRRASLQLRNVNPWTVLKFSCVLSIALFFVWLIVVGILFGILDAAGVIGKVNDTYVTIQGGSSTAPITAGVVFGGAAIIGLIDMVLFIALSTVGSVIYNLCADLVGGVEVTLSER